MTRALLTAVLALGLGACSWFDDSNTEPPAELVDFPATAKVSELWSVDTGTGPGRQYIKLAPVLHNAVLYVADTRGRVRALAQDSGKELWRTDLDLEITSGTGLGEDLVLVGSRKGEVIAMDKAKGHIQWRAQVPSEVLAPPAAEAGVVVVQSVDGRLTGLAAADGKRLWNVDRSEPALSLRGTATPVIVTDVVLTGFASGKIAAIGLQNGRLLWETPVAQAQGRSEIERLIDVDVPMLILGRTLLTAAYQGKIVAVDLENGRLLWSRDISTYSALDADRTNAYVSDVHGHVYALDLRTGATLWKQDKLQARRLSSPAVTANAVAVGDFEGYIHWLARDDGRFLARERVARAAVLTSPIADGATIYVNAQNGDLTALRLDSPGP